MFLHHVTGNAKPASDFLLVQPFEPTHDENLPASRRKRVYRRRELRDAFPSVKRRFRRRLRTQRFYLYALKQISVFRPAAAGIVFREVRGGRVEQRRRLQDHAPIDVTHDAQHCFLREVGRIARANLSREKTQELTSMKQNGVADRYVVVG